MSKEAFCHSGAYYDLLYRDKDYAAEASYVARILRSLREGGNDLLEFGSGTGRYSRLLAADGFRVTGVERSDSMVAIARAAAESRRASGSLDYFQSDIRHCRLGRTFDSVVSLFHVISYQTRNQDVIETFSNAARHLAPGGVFLFDVWHGPAVLTERPSVKVKRVEDETTRLIRISEPELNTDSSVVTVRYTIFAESKTNHETTTFSEEHDMRYFFPTEIDLFANQTGFQIEKSEEFLTGREPSDSSWGVAYMLRKSD